VFVEMGDSNPQSGVGGGVGVKGEGVN